MDFDRLFMQVLFGEILCFLLQFQIVCYGIEQEDIKVEDFIGDVKSTYLANLSLFKQQLQELLVVYSFQIPLKDFFKVYHQRYARALDVSSFGVDSVDALFGKVNSLCTSHQMGFVGFSSC